MNMLYMGFGFAIAMILIPSFVWWFIKSEARWIEKHKEDLRI
jgi:hypothetical protein